MTNEQIAKALCYCNGINCEGCPAYPEYSKKGVCTLPRDAAGRIMQLENKVKKQGRAIAALRKEQAKGAEV